jgi:hypothetical protein
VATAFSSLVLLVTAVFGLWQLQQLVEQRRHEMIMTLWSRLANKKQRDARRFVYGAFSLSLEQLAPRELESVEMVLNSMDYLGYLVESNAIKEKVVLELYLEVIHNCWTKLKPLVLTERQRRKMDRYNSHFERLAERCAQKATEYYPDGVIPTFKPLSVGDE